MDRDAFSTRLRAAQELLHGGQTADGLDLLNTLATVAIGPVRRAQVLALAADSQMRQGRFTDAATAYGSASALCWNRPQAFLRPALGQVLALLKDVQVAPAAARAREVVDHTVALAAAAGQSAAGASSALTAGGAPQTIGPRPPRPSVVARRFGRLFLAEGEPVLAEEFLNRAVALEPQGAFGGQLALAEIALGKSDPAGALATALAAWRAAGPLKGKMLAAIPLLVRSSNACGQLTDVANEISASFPAAKRAIRSRGTLVLVRALRAERRPDLWTGVANAWLTGADALKVPAVAAELRKALLADARVAQVSPAGQQAGANALLAVKGLGPTEYLAAAKELVRSTLFLGQTPDVEGLLARAVKAYGAGVSTNLLHGFAIAYMMAKQHDLARPLLARCLAASPVGGTDWSRAQWALARMEGILGNHAAAAQAYLLYGAQPAIPARFRLKARLEWAQSLVKAGQPAAIAAVIPDILAVLGGVNDYEMLLDFARQVQFAPDALKGLRDDALARGESLALQALAQATTPAATLEVLFKLTRRRNDLARFAANVTAWETLDDTKRAWLWTTKSQWWEYLALVATAYRFAGAFDRGDALVAHYLNDLATPAHGYAILGVTRGLGQIAVKQFPPALTSFRAATVRSPDHLLCAHAYYWLALDAWRRNADAEHEDCARRVLNCIGSTPTIAEYWELEGKAHCLLAGLQVDRVPAQVVRHSRQNLQDYANQILTDLATLGS